MRILVIDDDTRFLQDLKEALSRRGHDVQVLGDGRFVQSVADRYDPDWILTDLYTQGMDGLETIVAMRRKRSRARIVAMAKHTMPCAAHCLRFARMFGAEAVLVKPLEVDQLVDMLGEG